MAQRSNRNAIAVGMYSKNPTRRLVELAAAPGEVSIVRLAEWSRDLGDAALTIAEALASELASRHDTSENLRRQVVLYAEVGHEMHQLSGEIAGVTGIRAAGLGTLGDVEYQELIISQGRALELVLSQCQTAAAYVRARVEFVEVDGLTVARFSDKPGEGLTARVLATLEYLAGHIRAAKRMMRQFAANRAWKEVGSGAVVNLTDKMNKVIEGAGQ